MESPTLTITEVLSLYRSGTWGPQDDSVESKHVAPLSHYMFSITTVVFDGTSPPFICIYIRYIRRSLHKSGKYFFKPKLWQCRNLSLCVWNSEACTAICYSHIGLQLAAVASGSRQANHTTSQLLNLGFTLLWIWNKQYGTNNWFKLLTRSRSPWDCLRVVANEEKRGVPIRAEHFCTRSPAPRRRHAKWRSHSCKSTAIWW